MRFLNAYLVRFRGAILLGQGFKFAEAVLELAIPLCMAKLVDEGILKNAPAVVWRQGGLMVLLALVGVMCALICQVVATRTSVRFGKELRQDLFEKMQALDMGQLQAVGDSSLMNRMTNDVDVLQDALAMLVRLVVRAPFLWVGSVVMAVALNIRLSVVFLAVSPMIALLMWLILRVTAPRYKKMQALLDNLQSVFLEGLQGERVIRAFGRERFQMQRSRKPAQEYRQEGQTVGRLAALLSPSTSLVMNLGVMTVLILARPLVLNGSLRVGVVIAFVEYLAQILLQTSVIATLVILYVRAYASLQRVRDMMETEPEMRFAPRLKEGQALSRPLVAADGLCFGYNAGQRALDNLHFTLQKGEILGVIGGTGAGKTTLARLMMRLYDADLGTLTLLGQDIKTLPKRVLARHIAYVPQKNTLFRGTVRDNLQLEAEGQEDEDLLNALRLAQAEFVLKSPEGLDMAVEEGGQNLSGGQRQRLQLARGLNKDADLLILDDAFSALDFKTEAAIRRVILAEKHRRGTVLISQRASSLAMADRILVLENGRQMGCGTHDELMAVCPLYREIVASQQMGQAEQNGPVRPTARETEGRDGQ